MVANPALDSLYCECDEINLLEKAHSSSLYLVTDNTVRAHEMSPHEIIWIEGSVSIAF